MMHAPTAMPSIETIYDDFALLLYNYIYRRMGSRDRADDLLQETFVRICKAANAG